MSEAHERFRSNRDGQVSDVYPALANVPQDLFGLCVAGVNGANLCERRLGRAILDHERVEAVRVRVGLAGSGPGSRAPAPGRQCDRPAVQLPGGGRTQRGWPNEPNGQFRRDRAASLAPGSTLEEQWRFILDGLSRFAGRALAMNEAIFASASGSNSRNQAIGQLLRNCGQIAIEPADAVDTLYEAMFAQRDSEGSCRHGRDPRRRRRQSADPEARGRCGELQVHVGGHGDGGPLRNVGRLALRRRLARQERDRRRES